MISKELSTTLGLAVRVAKKRRHEYVCIEHLLYAILYNNAGKEIIESCGGSVENLNNTLEEFLSKNLESIPEGNEYVLQQTIGFQRVIQRAVNHARSAEKKEVLVSDMLASMFQEKDSYAAYFLNREGITRFDVLNYISHNDNSFSFQDRVGGFAKTERKEKKKAAGPLEAFTIDLVKRASEGKIDPLVGRKLELERSVQVLCRRRKNNPVYVGDPGVGKTAMAEGLANKIYEGDIPDVLKDISIYSLDLGAILAGTKFRGEFEQRLKGVLSELKNKKQAILFIDEIHTVVGAGATSGGSMDASNILKPVLAAGELRCIGSTTYEEYKNYFEKDRALSRRFEKIEIKEPSVSETVKILKGLRPYYEDFHGISYTDQSLKAAAELSAKFINDRYLPDKAIDVIDEAGKKVIFGQDNAIKSLVSSIKRSRAGLGTPGKPVGAFLFTGPTGVGKTEVARQVAAILGIELLRFDMSEYMEKHAVARLIGAPPGYIGFDQGGLLTDGIRKHPYSVLLLDEIEKAHQDMFNILLQIFDHATLTDNTGRKSDFRNVIIMMTSNAGAREMSAHTIGFGETHYDTKNKGRKAVEKFFSPEFRNRLDGIISFNSLTVEIMEKIVDKFIAELNEQLAVKKISISISSKARNRLAKKGHDPLFGARPLSRLIQTEIKDILTDEILFGNLSNGGKVFVDLENDKIRVKEQGSGVRD
jgi:ATP-dependent Clp protease ATP-binding subunit ClpA